MTDGMKSSEFIVTIAGGIAAVATVLLETMPPGDKWYVLVAAIGAFAAYIAGRSYVKATTIKADAVIKANESRAAVAQANPTQPG